MDCSQALEKLGAFVDQELPPAEAAAVSEHLGACEACRREYESLGDVAKRIASTPPTAVPDALWPAIEARVPAPSVESPRRAARWIVRRSRLAAAIVLAVGLGTALFVGPRWFDQTAQASTVEFRVLLDHVSTDPDRAFRKFLILYGGRQIPPAEAHSLAPELNFALPDVLSGGFRRGTVYALRFGNAPGIAAQYERDGDFLAVIFHPPVQQEDFGTHRDYPCVVGRHHGHKVEVGQWRLVHVTDPTTCHCVLSRLDEKTELPPVISAIVPSQAAANDGSTAGHSH